MGVKKDFQTLRQAIKNYIKDPTNRNADAITHQKDYCYIKYGKQATDNQTHQLFQTLS
jgi:hypothetical protein